VTYGSAMKKNDETGCGGGAAVQGLDEVARRYAVAITPAMTALMDSTDADDPIARQFEPDLRELDEAPGERDDPIGDDVHEAVTGLVHRYGDRVLVKLVKVCAVYCRFCFRREMVGPESGAPMTEGELAAAVEYIRAHPEIWEVILSGGDPFVLSARRIGEITRQLSQIPHVKVLRWHTRVPAVAPDRVTGELIEALASGGKTVWVALHANHPRELTPAARAACARIVDAGIPMVSQTVLLRGVNDDAATLETLMRGFVEARIKPYYLHHLDLAPGTGHFRTTIEEGQALMRSLRGRVSGLCQPVYVLDIPDGHGKVPIGPNYIEGGTEGALEIRDPGSRLHRYHET
jgi:lysine 2,3-aminomutase